MIFRRPFQCRNGMVLKLGNQLQTILTASPPFEVSRYFAFMSLPVSYMVSITLSKSMRGLAADFGAGYGSVHFVERADNAGGEQIAVDRVLRERATNWW